MKPNARGLLLFFFLAVGTSAGAAETDSGKEIYMQYCSSCHGKDGEAMVRSVRYLKIKVPDLTFSRKITKGSIPWPKSCRPLTAAASFALTGTEKCPFGGRFSERKPRDAKYPELTALA